MYVHIHIFCLYDYTSYTARMKKILRKSVIVCLLFMFCFFPVLWSELPKLPIWIYSIFY